MPASELCCRTRAAGLGALALLLLSALSACAQRDPQTLALRERIEQRALTPDEIPRFHMSYVEVRDASDAFRDREHLDLDLSSTDRALMNAARRGDVVAVRQQLQAGAKVNATDRLGNTALSHAAALGDLVLVRLLIKERADLEGRGGAMTPLAAASLRGHVQVVRLLLGQGADPDAMGLNDVAPLVLAVRLNHLTTVEALLQAGARFDALERTGDHVLMMAITNDQPAMVELLLRHGMNPNTADGDGLTPLYWARQLGRDAIAQQLEQAGANEQSVQVLESREYPMGDG